MGIFIGFWLGHKATVQFDRKHIYETIEACGLTLDELHRVNRYMADKANDEPDQLPQVLVRVEKHNDTFYAYRKDTGEFLAQSIDTVELVDLIKLRITSRCRVTVAADEGAEYFK